MRNAFYVAVVTFLLGLSIGHAGTEIQNGGSFVVAEFKDFAREVVFSIDDADFERISGISKSIFSNKINDSKVLCGSNLEIDGVPKEAINYPFETPPRILLDCEKWKSRDNNNSKRYGLALHEYLFLGLIDDSTYSVSSEVLRYHFKIRPHVEKKSSEMLFHITSCDIKNFEMSVREGGNVFFTNEFDESPLSTAIRTGCTLIVKELLNLGVIVEVKPTIYRALTYFLLKDQQVDCDNTGMRCLDIDSEQSMKLKLKVAKLILGQNREFFKFHFSEEGEAVYLPWDYWKFSNYDKKKCIVGSDLIHLLAYKTDKNEKLIMELIEFGFSLDRKNVCDESVRDILYSSNNSGFRISER